MGGLFQDRLDTGGVFAGDLHDALPVIAGYILRDLFAERALSADVDAARDANRLPANIAFAVTLFGNLVEIKAYLSSGRDIPTEYLDRVRARVMVIARRHNWTGYRVECSVKTTTVGVHELARGALIG